jgi:hypothetical protein
VEHARWHRVRPVAGNGPATSCFSWRSMVFEQIVALVLLDLQVGVVIT